MTKDTIIKFLNNNCTSAELEEVIQWANAEAFNEENKKWGFDDWNSYQVEDYLENDEKFSILFDKIQHKINVDNRSHEITKTKTSTISFFTVWLTRAAAILLIPVLAFLFYTISENKSESIKYTTNLTVDSLEIIAPVGSRAVVQLSDGSEVHLNYGSKLKYPQNFTGNTREVILLGEGYFNVAHNPEKPFIVRTEKLNVMALGTKFNVQAYPGEEIIATTLVEGKVVVHEKETNGYFKSIGTMEPGQHVNYNLKTRVVSSTKGSVEKYIAWKDGKLVFANESIIDVTNRLSRMFNVDFEIAENIKNYSYTVTFVDEPLFQILLLMTKATSISYKAMPREKLPDGSFSKQKIIIEKRK